MIAMREIRRAEKLRALGVDDEEVPGRMERDKSKGALTDDGDLVEPKAAWAKLREKMDADPDLKASVARAYPAYGEVLGKEPRTWDADDHGDALGCVRLIIEIRPGMFAEPNEPEPLSEEAPDDDTGEEPDALTAEALHQACKDAGIDPESEAFMDACEAVTGKRHLDEMDEAERAKVAEGLASLATS